jgi:pyruvate kinase
MTATAALPVAHLQKPSDARPRKLDFIEPRAIFISLRTEGPKDCDSFAWEAVEEMASILEEVEGSRLFERMPHLFRDSEYSFSNAIARACVAASEDLSLKALAVYSETGHSAALVSAHRPMAAIVALSRHEEVLRRLALRWGVLPVKAQWVEGIHSVVEQAQQVLLERNVVSPGDDIAVTFGMQDMTGPGRTDVLKLWRVKG